MTEPLLFTFRPVGASLPGKPPRITYTATDGRGYLYTIGMDVGGTNAFAAVYDPATLETLHGDTFFGCRVHADELKRQLQSVADRLAASVSV